MMKIIKNLMQKKLNKKFKQFSSSTYSPKINGYLTLRVIYLTLIINTLYSKNGLVERILNFKEFTEDQNKGLKTLISTSIAIIRVKHCQLFRVIKVTYLEDSHLFLGQQVNNNNIFQTQEDLYFHSLKRRSFKSNQKN